MSKVFAEHRFAPLVEPIADEPSFVAKPMFGCVGCYLHGRLVLLLADRREPWQGLLVPTEREAQSSLIADFDELRPHPVLPKWLFLPHSASRFTETAAELVDAVLAGDERIGVESSGPGLPRKRAASTRKKARKSS